ncbi:MAG: DUF4249 domain-containing protein [Bacteroidota bacterium]
MKYFWSIIILAVGLSGCQEPIELEFTGSETNYLVVEGSISTVFQKHQVVLSRSTPFQNNSLTNFIAEAGASVSIISDNGSTYFFHETEEGVYKSDSAFNAVESSSYELSIVLRNGESYSSTPQLVESSGTLDGVSVGYKEILTYNSELQSFRSKKGIELLADFSLNSNDRYVGFDWESTFIIKSEIGPNPGKECYIPDQTPGIERLINNAGLNQTVFTEEPVSFLIYDFRFRYRYSLNLIMYGMSKETYNFHNQVLSQLNSSGSIFEANQIQINGNIFNKNDADEVVLGNFSVFTQCEQRIFIDPASLPFQSEPFNICSRANPNATTYIGSGAPEHCFDCLTYSPSATDIKPSFWR